MRLLRVCQVLFKYAGSVLQRTNMTETPLHIACRKGKAKVKFLVNVQVLLLSMSLLRYLVTLVSSSDARLVLTSHYHYAWKHVQQMLAYLVHFVVLKSITLKKEKLLWWVISFSSRLWLFSWVKLWKITKFLFCSRQSDYSKFVCMCADIVLQVAYNTIFWIFGQVKRLLLTWAYYRWRIEMVLRQKWLLPAIIFELLSGSKSMK